MTIDINILSDLKGKLRVEIINIQPFQGDSMVLYIILKLFFHVYLSIFACIPLLVKLKSFLKKKRNESVLSSFGKSPLYEIPELSLSFTLI